MLIESGDHRRRWSTVCLLYTSLPEDQVRQLLDVATEEPGVVGIVDLEEQSVKVGDLSFCLLYTSRCV